MIGSPDLRCSRPREIPSRAVLRCILLVVGQERLRLRAQVEYVNNGVLVGGKEEPMGPSSNSTYRHGCYVFSAGALRKFSWNFQAEISDRRHV